MELSPVGPEEQRVLLQLAEYYVYDFSDLLGLDVDETGRFDSARLGRHFSDPICHPFLIRVDGKLAGFAIHEGRSRLSGEVGVHDVAELFVLKRFRRQGVGARAAVALFDRFVGPWEVREIHANVGATAFWRSTIDRYTGGAYTDVVWDDARFRGVVQRFLGAKSLR